MVEVSVGQAVFLGLSSIVNKVLTLLSVNETNPFFLFIWQLSQYLRLHSVEFRDGDLETTSKEVVVAHLRYCPDINLGEMNSS